VDNRQFIKYRTIEITGRCSFNTKISMNMMNSREKVYLHELFYLKDPGYSNLYVNVQSLLFKNPHLPLTWCHYISIMAASTTRCEYMVKCLEESFLASGGEPYWLILGLEIVPNKLKSIATLNNLIAHQPWKITTNMLKVIILYLIIRNFWKKKKDGI
jgi:hypothetical protein